MPPFGKILPIRFPQLNNFRGKISTDIIIPLSDFQVFIHQKTAKCWVLINPD